MGREACMTTHPATLATEPPNTCTHHQHLLQAGDVKHAWPHIQRLQRLSRQTPAHIINTCDRQGTWGMTTFTDWAANTDQHTSSTPVTDMWCEAWPYSATEPPTPVHIINTCYRQEMWSMTTFSRQHLYTSSTSVTDRGCEVWPHSAANTCTHHPHLLQTGNLFLSASFEAWPPSVTEARTHPQHRPETEEVDRNDKPT